MKTKSFTLIELLVVIVIIGILAGVIIVSTSSSISKANIAKYKVFSESIKNDLMINLVSEWKFDEGSGSEIKDSWGENHGTLTNGLWKDNDACISKTCLSFNTSTDYVIVPENDSLHILENLTLEMWIYPLDWKSVAGGTPIIDNNLYKFLHRSSNDVYFFYRIKENTYACDAAWYYWTGLRSDTLSMNKFHHVVGVMEGNYLRLYVNGVLVNENGTCFDGYTKETSAVGDTSFSFRLGENKGILDGVKVYNAALSTSQIKQEYIAGLNSLLANGSISDEEYSERLNNLALKF